MFNKNIFFSHTTNTTNHNKMTLAGVKAPFSMNEQHGHPIINGVVIMPSRNHYGGPLVTKGPERKMSPEDMENQRSQRPERKISAEDMKNQRKQRPGNLKDQKRPSFSPIPQKPGRVPGGGFEIPGQGQSEMPDRSVRVPGGGFDLPPMRNIDGRGFEIPGQGKPKRELPFVDWTKTPERPGKPQRKPNSPGGSMIISTNDPRHLGIKGPIISTSDPRHLGIKRPILDMTKTDRIYLQ